MPCHSSPVVLLGCLGRREYRRKKAVCGGDSCSSDYIVVMEYSDSCVPHARVVMRPLGQQQGWMGCPAADPHLGHW